MKVIATKKTDIDTAKLLQSEMLRLALGFFSPENYGYVCAQRLRGLPIELPVRYARYHILGAPEGTALYGTTSGGTYHSLTVRKDGLCTVVHEGARTSYPGLLMDISLKNPKFFDSENGWGLEIYETSEPNRAPVAGFLRGKFGSNAPANAREAEGGTLEKIKEGYMTAQMREHIERIEPLVRKFTAEMAEYVHGDGGPPSPIPCPYEGTRRQCNVCQAFVGLTSHNQCPCDALGAEEAARITLSQIKEVS